MTGKQAAHTLNKDMGADFAIGTDVQDACTFAGGVIGALTGAVTGNASTATILATARTIGGTSFDGSTNIAVALSATATALANARTIGGASFDGTANIVPTTIVVADSTDTTCFVGLWESATGNLLPKSDGALTYNAGTGALTAASFVGPLTGAATTAATVTSGAQSAITSLGTLTGLTMSGDVSTTAAVDWDLLDNDAAALSFDASGKTGILALDTRDGAEGVTMSGYLTVAGNFTVEGTVTTVNSTTIATQEAMLSMATGQTATDADAVDVGFYGTYDVSDTQKYAGFYRDATDGKFKLFKDNQAEPTTTVNTSGTGYTVATLVADLEGNADTITATANNSTDETVYPAFVDGATGAQGIETDTGLTYNPSSGMLTATGFTGALTGNASGTAATVTTAAQPAITSLGTLTTLSVDNITINGNDISSTAGTDLTITPLSGQQIVLDGTIIIDAGAVTGATSITSTAFVGALTGAATTAATATLATTVTVTDNDSTDEENLLPFLADAGDGTGPHGLESDTQLSYNPSTGTLTATVFSGSIATAALATTVTATANNSTDETVYPTFVDGASGTQGIETDSGLTYNPSTGLLTSTGFVGALTGNAATATLAATITVTDNEDSVEENAILFTSGAAGAGSIGVEADHSGLTYNPSAGRLTLSDGASSGGAIAFDQDTDLTGTPGTVTLQPNPTVAMGADATVQLPMVSGNLMIFPPFVEVTATRDLAGTTSSPNGFTHGLWLCNQADGAEAITLTLPTVSDCFPGFMLTFKAGPNVDSTDKVIIEGAGSEKIDGAANFELTTPYASITVVSVSATGGTTEVAGTNWIIT